MQLKVRTTNFLHYLSAALIICCLVNSILALSPIQRTPLDFSAGGPPALGTADVPFELRRFGRSLTGGCWAVCRRGCSCHICPQLPRCH
jgi:hypothetical protein